MQIENFNFNEIILSALAGNLTIFAFGYPYIYRAFGELSRISIILSERVKNKTIIKLYSPFVLTIIILNLISLMQSDSIIFCNLTIIYLLIHIIFIMLVYKTTEDYRREPYNALTYKDINNLKIKQEESFEKDIENDTLLTIDLIYFFGKNTYPLEKLPLYFNWLINITYYKFAHFKKQNLNSLLLIDSKDSQWLFSTYEKMIVLNQICSEQQKSSLTYLIDHFCICMMEYMSETHQENYKTAYPLLKLSHKSNISVFKHQLFLKQIFNRTTILIKNIYWNRIEHEFFNKYHLKDFVRIIYYILNNRYYWGDKETFEPCFKIICKTIDKNFSIDFYQALIIQIREDHDYFHGKYNNYYNICHFHIIIMGYMVFSDKLNLLKSYMNYEESLERSHINTLPQIPNSVNSIINNFIGKESVFCINKIFSENTSSTKYLFYVLFILLHRNYLFYIKYNNMLKEISHNHHMYDSILFELNLHSKFDKTLLKMHFEDLSFHRNFYDYEEYFNQFRKENLLLKTFNIENSSLNFISKLLSDTISIIKSESSKIIKTPINNIITEDFLPATQRKLNADNILDFYLKQQKKLCNQISKAKSTYKYNIQSFSYTTNLFNFSCDKQSFLSGGFVQIFENKITSYFYQLLFNIIQRNTKPINSITLLKYNKNYKIISNMKFYYQFSDFGFKDSELIFNTTNTQLTKYTIITSLKINNTTIELTRYSDFFYNLSSINTIQPFILFFDSSKITIEVINISSPQFSDSNFNEIIINDPSKIKFTVAKDKQLGFYLKHY